jgi:tetratricopeptide (TPR) repeat protein
VRNFVGRAAELRELADLVDQARVRPETVVISAIAGTAGVGKTALAVHWGHHIAHLFPGGQLYVNLRGFDSSGVPMTSAAAVRGFLDALHVPPGQIPAGLDAQAGLYRSLLAGRPMLVVLDNARDAEQVRPLLPGSPGCLAVVTSRSQLTGLIVGEGAYPLCLDVLTTPEAVRLLAGRVGAERAAAEEGGAAELIRLCARLPLAVSIAAARAAGQPAVTLAALAAELRDSRNLLDALNTGEAATSLRPVFSWSYQLLGPQAARLFRLLGLHPGADICVAAAGSLAGIPVGQAGQLLGELTRAHLVAEPEPGRFSFHDLLRAYATECAQAQEQEADRARAIHRMLAWYLHTAAAAAQVIDPRRRHVTLDLPAQHCEPLSFDDYDRALLWLETERANLSAAVACAGRHDAHEIAWKLPITLWDLFSLRGYWADWIESLETGLAGARHLQDRAAEGWLLNHLAMAYQQSGSSAQAIGCFRQALAIRRALGDRRGQAMALANLGRTYSEAGQLAESMKCLQEALSVFQDTGQRPEQGRCLFLISATYRRMSKFEDAMTCAWQAVDIIQQTGDGREESGALTQLALASLGLARPLEAITHSSRAAELSRHHGDRLAEAEALTVLGQAHQDCGHPAQARQHRHDAYLIFSDLGDPRTAEILGLLDPTHSTARS